MKDENLGKWEKRWHPLRREWVVYAAHRNSRPWSFDKKESTNTQIPEYEEKCYLCPGNTRVSGKQNPLYKDVFIFENDHPVVGFNSPDIPENYKYSHNGLYQKSKADGLAKVVCYDPRHNVTLAEIDVDKVAKVFYAWKKEMYEFYNNEKIKYGFIFENKGELVGVSNPHPHCQIYAVDFTIQIVKQYIEAVKEYDKDKSSNLFDDILRAEQEDELRVIAENENAIAFIPFYARYAYEVQVFPKKRHATFMSMNDSELYDLACVFQEVIRRYDINFQMSFPYVMAIIQAPVDSDNYEDFHMHLQFLPPLRQPGLVKFLAGPELGAGNFMADTLPEEKAKELRDIVL